MFDASKKSPELSGLFCFMIELKSTVIFFEVLMFLL